MNPGETLFLYTDGVTEAMNPNKEEFGETRLTETAAHIKREPVNDIISTLAARVKTHAGNEPQSDDITMLAIRYNGPEKAV